MSFDRRTLSLAFLFSVSTGVIMIAWAFQWIGGFEPCGLCLQQRQPYYLAVPLSALALYLGVFHIGSRWMKVVLAALLLIYAVSLFLAVRHMGVEWQWWLGPANCSAPDLGDLGEGGSLLEALENTNIAFCDQAAGRFLGLSFAGWNGVASLSLFLVGAYALIQQWQTASRRPLSSDKAQF